MACIDKLEHFATYTSIGIINTACQVKKGILTVFSSEGTYMLWDIYSLAGFEKWTKAWIANLEFLSLIPAIKGVFAKSLETLEGQKDLYYATMIIGAIGCFIKTDKNDIPIGLKIPRLKEGNIDYSAIFWCLAAGFDSAQFLDKYQVYHFNPKVQIFLSCKPKEYFVVLASAIDFYTEAKKGWQLLCTPVAHRNKYWTMKKWEILLKMASSIGKIVGITCYRKFKGRCWLTVVGVIGSNAGLFKFILEKYRYRTMRFECLVE